jgi:hypothetical protein
MAETVKERLMKTYKGEMDEQALEQSRRTKQRAAYPIMAIMMLMLLIILAAIIRILF